MAGISSPLQLFGDFGFSGGHDIAPNPLQNDQICINFYPEVNKQNAKEVIGLLGCPGLNQLAFAAGGGAPTNFTQGFTSTILLMHFDGNMIDSVSGTAFTVNVNGNAGGSGIVASPVEFGSGAFDIGSQPNLAWGGWNATSTNFGNVWNNDWTVECFVYRPSSTSGSVILAFGSSIISIGSNPQNGFPLTNQLFFSIDNVAGNPGFGGYDSGGNSVSLNTSQSFSAATMTHIAWVRHNNIVSVYVGGNPASATLNLSGHTFTGLNIANICGEMAQDLPMRNAVIDELRISNTAVYTAAFTPPSAPFSGSPVCRTVWPATSSVTNLPVRGLWELPNDSTALAVIGNTCYLVKVTTPAIGYPPAFPTLSLTSVGTLLTNTGPVSIRDNNAGGYAVIVDGPYGYLYNISSQVFTQITDPAFLGADTVAFIDGWWVFNQYSVNGSQTFYTNFPQYSTTFNGTYFALKDGAADNLRAVFENKEQLWLLGDKTTEIWYDAGGQYFAFQRLVGTMLQYGCKAAHSVARFYTEGQDGVIWFGRSERGENVILRSRGFTIDTVSTPAFSNEVSQYPIVNDAIGYTYQEDTHEFYMLIFPTADTTWCYDSQSGLLHKRLSYDPYLQQFHRHRSNCFMNFQGMRIVGDYQCGSLYQMTRNVFTDAGWPLLAKRRSPHVWDKGQRGRVFMASLQIDFQQGVGNPSCMGTDPQAGLAISRDGGKTFGQRWNAPIGKIGQYKNRTMWRKLAFGRDNVVDVEIIDPVKRDIIGVTLKAFSSA